MKPTKKTFCCTKCQRAFTRSDHLKRHHLHHMNPHPCISHELSANLRQIPAKSLTTFATTTSIAPSAVTGKYPRQAGEVAGDMHANL
ncbi:hypothetical protein N7501_004460 [Penicillium viridicatum]|nr:hypothetical protein N7501_004460 [Penicillium viridicatum]